MLQNIDTTTYNNDIVENVGNHLDNISKVLRAAKLKLDLTPPRAVVNAPQCISATIQTLDQLELNLDEMEMVLDEMDENKEEDFKFPTVILVVTSLICVCISAFITVKLAKGRL